MTLFMVTAEWTGSGSMFEGPASGRVMATEAPAAGAGWP
jgi:hypothetical protein